MMGKKQTNRLRNSRNQGTPLEAVFRRNTSIASRSQRAAREQRAAALQRQADQTKHQVRRVRRAKALAVVVAILLVVAGLRMQIKTVRLAGVDQLSQEQQARYSESIRSFSLENSFAQQGWSVDEAQVQDYVLSSFPEVSSAELKAVHLLNPALQVELSFRAPRYVWKDASNQQKFVDAEGKIFYENLSASKTGSLIEIEDQSGIVFEAGNTAVSSQTLAFIGGLQGGLKPLYKGDRVLKKVLIPVSTREVRVVPEKVPYYVKMSTARSLESQVGELKALLGFLRTKKITPKQYIDIRLEDKAYYK